MVDLLFPYLLLAITMAALVPALWLGAREAISYDGGLHLRISRLDHWESFLSAYREEAHPILYYLVLRAAAVLGNSPLACRMASIVPGMASVYLIGLIAARLFRNKAVALLAAAAYGFSRTVLGIILDLRGYPLALFFMIAAFYHLIDFIEAEYDARASRSLLLFGILTSLAIASEYYAILFFFSCLGVFALLWAKRPVSRENPVGWALGNRRALATALGLPFAVIAGFYQTHLKNLPTSFQHVSYFYWAPGCSRLDFVLRNLRADLNYMLPVEISSAVAVLGLIAVSGPFLASLDLRRKRPQRSLACGALGILLLLLLAELIALSLLRLYPFGGYARQQSVLFPFLTLAAFLLLDRLLSSLPASRVLSCSKAAIIAVIAASILADFSGIHLGKAVDSWHHEAPLQRLLSDFRRGMSPPPEFPHEHPPVEPSRPGYWLDLAEMAAGNHMPRTALAHLERAGGLDPEAEERGRMALLYQQLDEYGRALRLLDGLVAQKNTRTRWFNDRGVLKALMGDKKGAIEDLRAAHTKDPKALRTLSGLEALGQKTTKPR